MHHIKILEELLLILFSERKNVSLETGVLSGEDIVSLSEFATLNFSKNYRLVIGHQIELSSYRMCLNTVDLTV